VEGGCVHADTPTLKSIEVKCMFLEIKRMYLTPNDRGVYIALNAGTMSLMAINAHQVTIGKRLQSHDEQ
jgi:hypothetical protein